MAKKKYNPYSGVKGLMGVGIGGMAGLGAMGAMSGLPGMPAQAKSLTPIVGAGVGLAATGQMANIGLGLTKSMKGYGTVKKSKKHKGKKVTKW